LIMNMLHTALKSEDILQLFARRRKWEVKAKTDLFYREKEVDRFTNQDNFTGEFNRNNRPTALFDAHETTLLPYNTHCTSQALLPSSSDSSRLVWAEGGNSCRVDQTGGWVHLKSWTFSGAPERRKF
jgi:hypothetical protein